MNTEGISVKKATKNYMLFFALVSTDGSMGAADIADYIASHIQDPITRVPGVGDYTLFGSEYAMRIWLNPDKLYKYGLTVPDVVNAITAQNVQIPAGELGGLPANPGQRLDATMIGPGEFTTPDQFKNILLTVQTRRRAGAPERCRESRAWAAELFRQRSVRRQGDQRHGAETDAGRQPA